jgi:hypothetical protein
MHFFEQNADSVVQLVVGTDSVFVSRVSEMFTTELVSEIVCAAQPMRKSVPFLSATARNEYSPNGRASEPEPPFNAHGVTVAVWAVKLEGDDCEVARASNRLWQLMFALYG